MSVRMRIHPSYRELNRLADRALDEERLREVRQHLGACQSCRNEVALMRNLGRAAREISHPSPPDDALSQIMGRRAAGDRVILPVASALRASSRRRAIGIAAGIGGALLAAALLLLPASEASAGASDLRFDPAQPEPGDHIEVTYLPSSALAAEDVLYLRGAFRRAGDPVPRGGLPGAFRVELHPNPNGTFTGTLQMPDDVVFGYFAVENKPASKIDVKNGRFWPLLAHGDGKPTRDALREQLQVLDKNDVDFGLTAARMLVKHYPDDVMGRHRKLSYEAMTAIGKELERLNALREGRLLALHQTDHAAPAVVRLDAELEDKTVPEQLEVLEGEWMRARFSDDYIVARAFRLAREGQDPEAVLRWARRHNRVRPHEAGDIAETLARFPTLREPAKDGLRAELRRVEVAAAERRYLTETTEELMLRDRLRVRSLFGRLGRLLFEEGRYDAAIDTLELAIREGWDPDAFRSLAESYAAAGDTSEALTLFAYVVAGESDRVARRELESALQHRFAALLTDELEWSSRVAESSKQIDRRRIEEIGRPIRPSGNPTVHTRKGERRALEEVVGDEISVVVLWAGPPSLLLEAIKGDLSRTTSLHALGTNIITITENQASPELDQLMADAGLTFPVFYDQRWEAARSLNSLGVPYYYVVDRHGGFYFAEDMNRAIRLAQSLLRAADAAA